MTKDAAKNIPLYPPITPFDQREIHRDGYAVYVEQSGNPAGRPVVVCHGGPGGGSFPLMRRFFDPAHYRIILFDQRGAGRSAPVGATERNTTRHLLADMEAIRRALDIGRWTLFGGSWGATLALLYAQSWPERVDAMVLRGVFLGTKVELDWFYGGGAARFFPDEWAAFCALVPESERGDMIGAYHKRLFSGNWAEELRFAQAWTRWETALSTVEGRIITPPATYAHSFARLECHYFVNGCFLDDDQIMRHRDRIESIPTMIVQGRLDMVCPPQAAWRLAKDWPKATLFMVNAAGHTMSEPGIAAKLLELMEALK